MTNDFIKKLRNRERLLGTLVTLQSPEVCEILVACGFDWLFIDTEHAPFDAATAQQLLQASGRDFPCIVRVPASNEVWIKKALDIGAAGVIVPQVNTPEQARHIVSLCKYPPEGTRGVGLARAHGYGLAFQEYLDTANDDVAVILQAEHTMAVKNIEEIVKVPGIDAILIGPYDLSASMGKTGKVSDPDVRQAINKVTQCCQEADIPLGIFGVNAEAVKPYIDMGFNLVAVGVDVTFISSAAKDTLHALKA